MLDFMRSSFLKQSCSFFQNDILHVSAKFGANILNSHSLGRPIEFYSFSKWQPNVGLIAFYMNSKCHSADGIQRDLFVFLPNLLETAIQSLRRYCNFQIFKTTSNHHHAFKKQSFQVPVRLRVGLCVILPNFSDFLINFFFKLWPSVMGRNDVWCRSPALRYFAPVRDDRYCTN